MFSAGLPRFPVTFLRGLGYPGARRGRVV